MRGLVQSFINKVRTATEMPVENPVGEFNSSHHTISTIILV
jgi:hypothetical protein